MERGVVHTPRKDTVALLTDALALAPQERAALAEAARRLGVAQPRISDLVRGKIERFTIDTLVTMLSHAGADVTVTVKRRRSAA
jgi:predicted XRE-type DNA-binding protein